MKQIKINTYSFGELNQEAKDNAIEYQRGFTADTIDLDYMVEDLEENLKELGFYEPKILYSGFHSQGDGACFEFCNIDFEKFLTKHKIKSKFRLLIKHQDYITFRAAHCGPYYHENCVDTFQEINSYLDCHDLHYRRSFNALEDQLIDFQRWFEEWRVNKCKEIYESLNSDYDYLLSDENILNTLSYCNHDFDQDGDIINF